MRIGGKKIAPNEEILVLPRVDGDIIIHAKAVTDMSEFEALVPEPKANVKLTKDGPVQNIEDPTYKEQVLQHTNLRFAYIVIKSLEPSDIEWETVDMGSPKTWPDWEKELSDGGLSTIEINRVGMCVMQANSLDEGKLAAARADFLRGKEEEEKRSSGPQTEPESTPSGKPVQG